jgi:hypothetical protein
MGFKVKDMVPLDKLAVGKEVEFVKEGETCVIESAK